MQVCFCIRDFRERETARSSLGTSSKRAHVVRIKALRKLATPKILHGWDCRHRNSTLSLSETFAKPGHGMVRVIPGVLQPQFHWQQTG